MGESGFVFADSCTVFVPPVNKTLRRFHLYAPAGFIFFPGPAHFRRVQGKGARPDVQYF
jgi:hypothetical protein